MGNKKRTGYLNNYTDNKYFNEKKKEDDSDEKRKNECDGNYPNPYPDFTVKTSIDFLTLSIKENVDQQTLKSILISIGFKSVRNNKLDNGNYQMEWIFKHPDTGVTAEVFYAPKELCFPSMSVKLHDPNLEVVNSLHQSFIKNKINHKLSFVELTFDFFTADVIRLREYLKSFTFMKNARSKAGRKETTFYLNDLRKSVRGMRIYTKPNWDHVRMEVTLKSPILKRLGLSLPLASIDSLDVTRYFLFKSIDQEHLRKYLIWSNRKLIERLNRKRPGSGDLVACQITSWINCIVMNDRGGSSPLMDQVGAFKAENAIPNFNRFLLPFDDFNAKFTRQVSGQKFLR